MNYNIKENKRIAVFSATRSLSAEETPLYKSITKIKKITNVDIFLHVETNNKEGLSKIYNRFLNKEKNNYDYIVFIHDDVFVDDIDLPNKLYFAHEVTQYDIVGLAGGLDPKIIKPALWHIMCGGWDERRLRGSVAHPVTPTQIIMTTFGVTPCRVTILDGLFLSIKTESLKNNDWKFNENYDFHHYDISSCIDANAKKLTLGTFPIWVVHHSPGLLNPENKMFLESQEKFLKEYSD